MGQHQALTTAQWGITRQAQDELAAASHHNLAAAWDRLTEVLTTQGLAALADVPASRLDPDVFTRQEPAPSTPASDSEPS